MSGMPRTEDVLKCFVARFQSTICHLEVVEEPGQAKAVPWVEDRLLVRPVLNATGLRPEFLADVPGMALQAVISFLEDRFGSLAELPHPCNASDHIKAAVLPLAWTDTPPLTERL